VVPITGVAESCAFINPYFKDIYFMDKIYLTIHNILVDNGYYRPGHHKSSNFIHMCIDRIDFDSPHIWDAGLRCGLVAVDNVGSF
jgi:hypothetical protein